MITIVAKLTAAEGKADQLKAAMLEMISNVKQHEAGKALAYSLHTSDTEPNTFLFYEQYADAAAVEAHGKTDHMRAFGLAIRDGALTASRPVVERYTQIGGVS